MQGDQITCGWCEKRMEPVWIEAAKKHRCPLCMNIIYPLGAVGHRNQPKTIKVDK
jgi:hypothetical protein